MALSTPASATCRARFQRESRAVAAWRCRPVASMASVMTATTVMTSMVTIMAKPPSSRRRRNLLGIAHLHVRVDDELRMLGARPRRQEQPDAVDLRRVDLAEVAEHGVRRQLDDIELAAGGEGALQVEPGAPGVHRFPRDGLERASDIGAHDHPRLRGGGDALRLTDVLAEHRGCGAEVVERLVAVGAVAGRAHAA